MEMNNDDDDDDDDDDELSDSSSSYEPEYEEQLVTVVSNAIELTVWMVLPPPLEYMSALHSRQQEISGRQVWTGSMMLANLLYEKRETLHWDNQRILELGSGTGILGMSVAKMCNPASLILTDGDEKAIELLQQNIDNPRNQIDKSLVKVDKLLWGSQHHDASAYNNSTFDVILAGDVLYKKELPQLFFETVSLLLNQTEGTLWLCHVPRARVTHQIVTEAAQEAGFQSITVEPIDHLVATTNCPTEDATRAQVYRIRRE